MRTGLIKTLQKLAGPALLGFALFLILTRNQTISEYLSNADLLFRESIYQAVFLNHESISSLRMMASPDLIQLGLYCLCRLFLSVPHTIIVLTLLSLALFYYFSLQIAQLLSRDNLEFRLYENSLLLGITLLTLPHFWVMGTLNQALDFDDHFFNIGVMSVISLWLLLRILVGSRYLTWNVLGLLASTLCTSVSEPSYQSCWVGPSLLALIYLFYWKPALRKRILLGGFVIATAGWGGFFLLKHLALFHLQIDYSYILNPLQRPLLVMLMQIGLSLLLFAWSSPMLCLAWLICVGYLFRFKTEHLPLFYVRTFLVALLCTGFVAILLFDPDITPTTSISLLGAWFFRHSSSMVYLPLFLIGPLLLEKFTITRLPSFDWQYKAFILILQLSLFYAIPPMPWATLWAPPEKAWPWLQCINQVKQQYHLQQGLGSYWTARPVQIYAHLPVEPVLQDFSPYTWLADAHSFDAKTADFVLVDDWIITPKATEQHFGPPIAIFSCPLLPLKTIVFQVWVYSQFKICHNPESGASL